MQSWAHDYMHTCLVDSPVTQLCTNTRFLNKCPFVSGTIIKKLWLESKYQDPTPIAEQLKAAAMARLLILAVVGLCLAHTAQVGCLY
jgi:hypothetical protein